MGETAQPAKRISRKRLIELAFAAAAVLIAAYFSVWHFRYLLTQCESIEDVNACRAWGCKAGTMTVYEMGSDVNHHDVETMQVPDGSCTMPQ